MMKKYVGRNVTLGSLLGRVFLMVIGVNLLVYISVLGWQILNSFLIKDYSLTIAYLSWLLLAVVILKIVFYLIFLFIVVELSKEGLTRRKIRINSVNLLQLYLIIRKGKKQIYRFYLRFFIVGWKNKKLTLFIDKTIDQLLVNREERYLRKKAQEIWSIIQGSAIIDQEKYEQYYRSFMDSKTTLSQRRFFFLKLQKKSIGILQSELESCKINKHHWERIVPNFVPQKLKNQKKCFGGGKKLHHSSWNRSKKIEISPGDQLINEEERQNLISAIIGQRLKLDYAVFSKLDNDELLLLHQVREFISLLGDATWDAFVAKGVVVCLRDEELRDIILSQDKSFMQEYLGIKTTGIKEEFSSSRQFPSVLDRKVVVVCGDDAVYKKRNEYIQWCRDLGGQATFKKVSAATVEEVVNSKHDIIIGILPLGHESITVPLKKGSNRFIAILRSGENSFKRELVYRLNGGNS